MPKLDPANYGPWLLALRPAAYTTEASQHITGNSPLRLTPTPPHHIKKKHYILGKILSSVPSEILNHLLTPLDDPTPYEPLTKIITHLDTSNASDHEYLKQEVEQCNYTSGMSRQQYVTAHNNICTKMIAARYPNISDLTTTVDFRINGLRLNPSTSLIGLELMALAPKDVKDFSHKFKKIATYNTPLRHQPSPHHALTFNGLLPLYADFLFSPNPLTPYPRRRSFKPCQHHLREGLDHPQHINNQCPAPDHPKNKLERAPVIPTQRRLPRRTHARLANLTPGNPAPDLDADFHLQDTPETAPHQTIDNLVDTADDPDRFSGAFILDSGAHPSHIPRPIQTISPLPTSLYTRTATNQRIPCSHHGTAQILTDRGHRIRLKVIVNPQIQQPLISAHDLAKTTGPVTFHHKHATIYNHRARVLVSPTDIITSRPTHGIHPQKHPSPPTHSPLAPHHTLTPRHRRPPKFVPPPSKPLPHPPIRRIISSPHPKPNRTSLTLFPPRNAGNMLPYHSPKTSTIGT